MQLDQLINVYLTFQSTRRFDGLVDTERHALPTAPGSKVITVDVVDLFCMFLPTFSMSSPLYGPYQPFI